MSNKTQKDKENWVGKKFANGWVIVEKYNCAEYRAIYQAATGDMEKKIKNSHYLCHNEICNVDSYFERTVIDRALRNNTPIMSKCKGCKDNCFYANAVRVKNVYKEIDRTPKIKIGDTSGLFVAVEIIPSSESSDHQIRVKCKCRLCGAEKLGRADQFLNGMLACECDKNHSSGEKLVKDYLIKNNFNFRTEETFNNLYGDGGGSLRYDFAILDKNNNVIKLIEFDGEQHFQGAGSYFNEKGKVQIHDNRKNEYAINNNIPLLRIPYWDINNIDKLLKDFLNED